MLIILLNIMKNKRKTKLYGGIEVYSKDGKLMFRCDEKKRQWYLTRNLAESISENSIKLNFEANGTGEPSDILLVEKKNECVVCGCADHTLLTPHHIIPREFRVHFPENLKSHSSLFVVCLCDTCHKKYEETYANALRKQLRAKYVPKQEKKQYEFMVQMKLLSKLLHKLSAGVPHEDSKNNLIASGDFFEYDRSKLGDVDYVYELYTKVEEHKKSKLIDIPFGKKVIDAINGDYLEFSMIWVEDFFNNMKPNIDKEKFYNAIDAFVKNRMLVPA